MKTIVHNPNEAILSGVSIMVKKKKQSNQKLEQISIRATEWIGTTTSIIVHSIFFIGIFALYLVGFSFDSILLILTTAVSLEAIYLAIFIQMTVNRNTKSLEEVEADIDEIQEDVEGLEEDVEEISTDIDEIQAEEQEEVAQEVKDARALDSIRLQLQRLQEDLDNIKKVAKI